MGFIIMKWKKTGTTVLELDVPPAPKFNLARGTLVREVTKNLVITITEPEMEEPAGRTKILAVSQALW